MTYKNLIPGQYQIGDLVLGRGTSILVNEFEAQAYDMNVQDYQVGMADETRFGMDQIKPTTIQMKMSVLYNELLDAYKHTDPNFWKDHPRIEHLASAWRADYIRKRPGEMIPLYLCGKNNEERIVFGRPGQFQASKLMAQVQGQAVDCMAEFRRADILNYGIKENAIEILRNDSHTEIHRTEGDAPSWIRLIASGPMTNPVFTIGEHEIRLNHSIKDGELIELSSYPWQRRIIDSNRVNLAAYATGSMPYLDRISLQPNRPTAVRWSSEELNTWVPALGNQSWETDINDHKLFQIPDTFTTLAGKAAIRFDFFNFGSTQIPWITPRTYISAAALSDKTAILYNAKQYKTNNQYAKARIVEPKWGKSGIVIMSNDTMTNYACLVVESGIGNNRLHIASGTSPTSVTIRASWQNTAFGGWKETDDVAIDYDPATKTYTGYVNDVAKVTWADSGGTVTTDLTKHNQGFLFDIDGNLLTTGVGFANIICYDKGLVPPSTGTDKVFLMWRDAWGAIP